MVRSVLYAASILCLFAGSLGGCESAKEDPEDRRRGAHPTFDPNNYPYHDGQYTHDDENEGD